MKKVFSRMHILKFGILIIFTFSQLTTVKSENLKRLVNLEGNWKFSIGDDLARAAIDYDDSDWENVFAPKSWEQNGFYDYDGYAWYRKTFQVRLPFDNKYLYFYMGQIDDVDEVYLNGKLIGASGNFPPQTKTAFDIHRMYPIPAELLRKEGYNTLAVRVFDGTGSGGISQGPLGIFVDKEQDRMMIDLTGHWDFECGTAIDKGNLNCITYKKGKIFVPGFWEARGYNGLDGNAKYTKEFTLQTDMSTIGKALVLGVIDDTDEVYLNGEKLTAIGAKQPRRNYYNGRSNYLAYRFYPIRKGILQTNRINILEVMVTDRGGAGGICKGPIGITSVEIAELMARSKLKDNRTSLEKFFQYWFD